MIATRSWVRGVRGVGGAGGGGIGREKRARERGKGLERYNECLYPVRHLIVTCVTNVHNLGMPGQSSRTSVGVVVVAKTKPTNTTQSSTEPTKRLGSD